MADEMHVRGGEADGGALGDDFGVGGEDEVRAVAQGIARAVPRSGTRVGASTTAKLATPAARAASSKASDGLAGFSLVPTTAAAGAPASTPCHPAEGTGRGRSPRAAKYAVAAPEA